MVPLESIQKAHSRMTYCHIYQLVNLRHREKVLRAGLIQVREIYTYAPFLVLLLYHHGISQPFRVKKSL